MILSLHTLTKNICQKADRIYRPWAVEKTKLEINFLATHLGNIWFVFYLKNIIKDKKHKNIKNIKTLIVTGKNPKQKTCQIRRKRLIFDDFNQLNCITARRFEILNRTIIRMTCIMRKNTKNKIFKQFFNFLNSLSTNTLSKFKTKKKLKNYSKN